MTTDRYSLMKMPCGEIGRALACSSDEDQAAVVNALAKELKIVCRDQTLSGTQVCYFAAGLDRHGQELIESLAEFVKLRRAEDTK